MSRFASTSLNDFSFDAPVADGWDEAPTPTKKSIRKDGDDCGTGAGGFKPGNTCGGDAGGGDSGERRARAPNEKPPEETTRAVARAMFKKDKLDGYDLPDPILNEITAKIDAEEKEARENLEFHLAEGHSQEYKEAQTETFERIWEDNRKSIIERSFAEILPDGSIIGSDYVKAAIKSNIANEVGIKVGQALSSPELSKQFQSALMEMKDKIPSGAYNEHKPSVHAESYGAHTKFVSALLGAWANTSGDSYFPSLTVQESIRREFLIDGKMSYGQAASKHPTDQGGNPELIQAQQFVDRHSKVMSVVVREIYNHTQAELKKAGIDELTVYRGMRIDNDVAPEWMKTEVPKQGFKVVKEAEIKLNPISSFSTSFNEAHRFGTGGGGNHRDVIMAVKVPRENIFSTFLTGPGCANEAEVVVLGKPTTARVHVSDVGGAWIAGAGAVTENFWKD